MILGINHITLSVHNLEQSIAFYQDILGFKLRAKWSKGAYFLAGELWLCLIRDDFTRQSALPEYSHIAFNIAPEDFKNFADKICQYNISIWQNNSSEGDSLYFLDPNGHKLELHCSNLAARLKACQKKPYENMEFFD